MKNRLVADMLRKIAQLLEIKGDLVFKIRAFEKAAFVIDNLEEDIEEIWKQGKLNDITSVGEGISKKISDFLQNGSSKFLDDLKTQVPVKVDELGRVSGLGPKTILKLYKELKVKNLKDLEKAAKKHKISKIKGLGPGVEENILNSIGFAKSSGERFRLGDALRIAEQIKIDLIKFKEIKKIEFAGSLRRKKETIGDIDVLIISDYSDRVSDIFSKMENVAEVIAKGSTKTSVRLDEGIQADLRVFPSKNYGAALLYFTGSQMHNIALRKLAIKKGMKLSEYGLFDKKTYKNLASKREIDCYKKLGLKYIEPELREDDGEVEAAIKNKLPKLITDKDIKGDLQMHSTWSDGRNSILEMAQAAKKLGHKYICMTDHCGILKIANALDEKRIKKQKKEIDIVNKKLKGVEVLHGLETNILYDGKLDMKNSVLKEMDIVLGAIHTGLNNKKEKINKRFTLAMENEHLDIIGHPTGRLINIRPALDFDLELILDKAKETKTILEVNASPKRLDLKDVHIRAAIDRGVKLSLGTDSHDVEQLKNYKLGVATARRGWATKKDIINTYSVKDMKRLLK